LIGVFTQNLTISNGCCSGHVLNNIFLFVPVKSAVQSHQPKAGTCAIAENAQWKCWLLNPVVWIIKMQPLMKLLMLCSLLGLPQVSH